MSHSKIVFIDPVEEGMPVPDVRLVEEQLTGLDFELEVHVCQSDGEVIEAVKGADVIINRGLPMPREVIQEIDKAQAIVTLGHGFNEIDHDAATDQGVMLVNTAGFCTDEVSSHTIMLLLACARNLGSLNELVKSGKWAPRHSGAIHLPLTAIDGQTLGLIGCGNIARATARKAKVFGLETIAYDPYVEPWVARDYGIDLVAGLDELARRSDFVSMHVPLNNQTRRLVGEGFFKAMKSTAYFINTCRGETVDERALIEALENGELAGAGLDVFEEEPVSPDNPLLKMDNVVATPHSAGSSVEAYRDAEIQMGQEAARIMRGMWPFALVNPEVRGVIPKRHAALNA